MKLYQRMTGRDCKLDKMTKRMGQASQRFRIEEEEDGNILIVVGISPLQQFWPDPGAVHMHWPFISLRIVKGTMRVPYTLLFLVNSKHFIYRKNLSNRLWLLFRITWKLIEFFLLKRSLNWHAFISRRNLADFHTFFPISKIEHFRTCKKNLNSLEINRNTLSGLRWDG